MHEKKHCMQALFKKNSLYNNYGVSIKAEMVEKHKVW